MCWNYELILIFCFNLLRIYPHVSKLWIACFKSLLVTECKHIWVLYICCMIFAYSLTLNILRHIFFGFVICSLKFNLCDIFLFSVYNFLNTITTILHTMITRIDVQIIVHTSWIFCLTKWSCLCRGSFR